MIADSGAGSTFIETCAVDCSSVTRRSTRGVSTATVGGSAFQGEIGDEQTANAGRDNGVRLRDTGNGNEIIVGNYKNRRSEMEQQPAKMAAACSIPASIRREDGSDNDVLDVQQGALRRHSFQ